MGVAMEKAEIRKELMMVTTSQTSSSTEVEMLKNRINDTEREKRELVGVVSRLKEDDAMRNGPSHFIPFPLIFFFHPFCVSFIRLVSFLHSFCVFLSFVLCPSSTRVYELTRLFVCFGLVGNRGTRDAPVELEAGPSGIPETRIRPARTPLDRHVYPGP